jgi:hypothetical protein
MKIHLISNDNEAGLSTDMHLLEEILTSVGHEVHRIHWTARSMYKCDVGIFLELMQPRLFPYMSHAVGIFNMEWFRQHWRRYLNNMTQLWAKGEEAHEVFNIIGQKKKSHLTGFASRDMYEPGIAKLDQCFHLKGYSDLKNTPAIIEAWRRHPDLPPLTIVSKDPVENLPDNVSFKHRITQNELVRLMNESYMHLCPSRSEGWGHYITEGMSTGAMVISTNASPMNEHVKTEWGMLVESTVRYRRGMVHEYDVNPDSIAEAVFAAMALDPVERAKRSQLARDHIASRNQQFKECAVRLLGEL